jgi:hypothetical protein
MRLENLTQTHVLGGYWLPLACYAVHRAFREPTWPRIAAASAAYLLVALASWYYVIIGAVGLAVVTLGDLAVRPQSRWVVLRRAALAALPLVLVLGLIARPYATVSRQFLPSLPHAADVAGAGADEEPPPEIDRTMNPGVMQALSAPVESYLGAPGRSLMPWTRRLRGYGQPGARFFPGVIAMALALWTLTRVVRVQLAESKGTWIAVLLTVIATAAVLSAALGAAGSPFIVLTRLPGFFLAFLASLVLWLVLPGPAPFAAARSYVILAATGALLSLGQQISAFEVVLGHGVYPATLPPFNLLRAPARFGVLYSLGVAVMAAFGLADLARRIHRERARIWTMFAALAVLNLEAMVQGIDMPRLGRPSAAYEWLRTAAPGAVLEFPIHGNGESLYWSLFHRQPIANGYGLVEPAAYHRLKEDDLSRETLEHARAYFHPRYLVVNRARFDAAHLPVADENLSRVGDMLTPIGTFGFRRVFEMTGPSRGTTVLRSYPGWMVNGKREVAVTARLEHLPARGVAAVQVWGNGRLLASGSSGSPLIAPVPQQTMGGLDVEVLADYAIAAGTGAAIGRTGQTAPAEIAVHVDPQRTRLQINGHVYIGRKGYTLVTLDADGRVRGARAFNTSWSEPQSHALASYIRALEPGRVVAVATAFDASRSLTEDAVAALRTLGIATDLRGRFGLAHAAIGVSGAAPGTALESSGESSATCAIGSPVELSIVVEDVRLR